MYFFDETFMCDISTTRMLVVYLQVCSHRFYESFLIAVFVWASMNPFESFLWVFKARDRVSKMTYVILVGIPQIHR